MRTGAPPKRVPKVTQPQRNKTRHTPKQKGVKVCNSLCSCCVHALDRTPSIEHNSPIGSAEGEMDHANKTIYLFRQFPPWLQRSRWTRKARVYAKVNGSGAMFLSLGRLGWPMVGSPSFSVRPPQCHNVRVSDCSLKVASGLAASLINVEL